MSLTISQKALNQIVYFTSLRFYCHSPLLYLCFHFSVITSGESIWSIQRLEKEKWIPLLLYLLSRLQPPPPRPRPRPRRWSWRRSAMNERRRCCTGPKWFNFWGERRRSFFKTIMAPALSLQSVVLFSLPLARVLFIVSLSIYMFVITYTTYSLWILRLIWSFLGKEKQRILENLVQLTVRCPFPRSVFEIMLIVFTCVWNCGLVFSLISYSSRYSCKAQREIMLYWRYSNRS